jgi:hypothetical protein
MEPTTPAVHWAITSLGLLIMNKGEPITGKGKRSSGAGSLDKDVSSRDFYREKMTVAPASIAQVATDSIAKVQLPQT